MTVDHDPRVSANLLVVEIGNSHVSVATTVVGRVYSNHRFDLDQIDDIVACAEASWEALPEEHLKAVAAASVVPGALERVRQAVSSALDEPVAVVGEDLHRPISVALEDPTSIGIDRLCSAAAAYDTLKSACVIASFGTAITIDCVNNEGTFMGGAILPGLQLQAHALGSGTAQLPEVPIEPPKEVFGSSTVEAIRSGILFGAAGALREITERYASELGAWPDLIVTGGHAQLVREHSEIIDRVVPDLCIRGIALAYRKHFLPFEELE